MVERLLLNGDQKVTLIERFDNRALILASGQRWEFDTLNEAKGFVAVSNMEVSVAHLFGSSVKRELQ